MTAWMKSAGRMPTSSAEALTSSLCRESVLSCTSSNGHCSDAAPQLFPSGARGGEGRGEEGGGGVMVRGQWGR